ncbi:MAG: hypothetical protein H6738_03630 [Alphaproteobacteria bacterium]|nr:hypothetical protein [Alphaproteobacteria bacterium]MCB9695859.1 hypothetical protein [Alphaproteobacteria bacterium]
MQPEDDPVGGLTFFGLFQSRAAINDLASTNPFLDGQVVGRLGGTNGVVVDPTVVAAYTEERVNGFFTYAPPLANGKASLTAAFEIDFAFGDRSYGVGGNVGGGFGGDQVNLQTRRLHADFFPSKGMHSAHVIVGLQFLSDSVADPTRSTPDQLMRSGGRMAFFASEAAGVAVYGKIADDWGTRVRYRAGLFTLAENGLSLSDDVLLAVADVEGRPAQATAVGAHLWYLQDRSGGVGGTLGLGPTSALYELQGGAHIDLYDGLPPPDGAYIDADLVWAGVDGGFNAALDRGPYGVHAAIIGNLGRLYAPIVHDDDVAGLFLDAEARARYAPGDGSVARAEVLVTTPAGANDLYYGGVVTGNAYGVAGALMPTHGTLLLFPDARAINRLVSVVADASAAGRGVTALTTSVGYDVIPARLNVLGRAATAMTSDGVAWGTELGGSISGRPLPLVDLGVHGAVLLPGPAAELTATPWAGYVALDWLVL